MTRFILCSLFSIIVTCGAFGQKARRIVSLAPSLTKNIYYLGCPDKLVGCTSYCTEALADNKAVVASAIKVNLEKTVSLKPDLVLTTPLTDPETIESLRKFGIRVEVFPSAVSFNGICRQFIEIGKLLGEAETALEIVTASENKIEQLLEKNPVKNPGRFFIQIGADPIFTVLPNTFMNDFILLTGGKNIFDDLNRGTVTRESVVARNPDYIFIATMGIVSQEEKTEWERFNTIGATKNGAIFTIDADKACTPTPVTFVETFETIISCLAKVE
ncbi:MAG: helical backbone metal receptor [Prolixibacteraceae bacterium]|nr:helical backbone metal receptor [Prolixibacteraceae bacterium]